MSDNKQNITDIRSQDDLEVNARQVEGYTDDEDCSFDSDGVGYYVSNVKTIALGCLAAIMIFLTLRVLILTAWAAQMPVEMLVNTQSGSYSVKANVKTADEITLVDFKEQTKEAADIDNQNQTVMHGIDQSTTYNSDKLNRVVITDKHAYMFRVVEYKASDAEVTVDILKYDQDKMTFETLDTIKVNQLKELKSVDYYAVSDIDKEFADKVQEILEENKDWAYDNTIYTSGSVYVSFKTGKDATEIYEYNLEKDKFSKRCFIKTESIKQIYKVQSDEQNS